MCAHISVLVIAGHETSAGTISWCLYDVATRPDIQSKLKEELRGMRLLSIDGEPCRDLQWEDLNAAPFFNTVLKESMRLHSISGHMSAIR